VTDCLERPPAQKEDPESLAIRARPARAIRFRRGLIVGLVGASAVGLTGVAWFALKPVAFTRGLERQELSEPAAPASDTLDKLPTSYGDAPKLGPPLPGDLGRPILARQRELVRAGVGNPGSLPPAVSLREEAIEPRATSLQSARASDLLIQLQSASSTSTVLEPPSLADAPPEASLGSRLQVNERDAGASDRGSAPAEPRHVLASGSVIAGSLLTGLRSDLPGLVLAQVTEPAYDSTTGRVLLVPQGTRLIGRYESANAFGQRRALIVWERMILPDGRALMIENAPATDPAGYGGLEDRVDFHSWSLLKGVALSTLLGLAPELALGGGGDLLDAIRRTTQIGGARAGDQIVGRSLDMRPTITIRPGARVRMLVHKDMLLQAWTEEEPEDE